MQSIAHRCYLGVQVAGLWLELAQVQHWLYWCYFADWHAYCLLTEAVLMHSETRVVVQG
jgi:hypothetical protein